jgi:hypothetical protein
VQLATSARTRVTAASPAAVLLDFVSPAKYRIIPLGPARISYYHELLISIVLGRLWRAESLLQFFFSKGCGWGGGGASRGAAYLQLH